MAHCDDISVKRRFEKNCTLWNAQTTVILISDFGRFGKHCLQARCRAQPVVSIASPVWFLMVHDKFGKQPLNEFLLLLSIC